MELLSQRARRAPSLPENASCADNQQFPLFEGLLQKIRGCQKIQPATPTAPARMQFCESTLSDVGNACTVLCLQQPGAPCQLIRYLVKSGSIPGVLGEE